MSMFKRDYSGETINGAYLNYRLPDYIPPGGGKGLARYNCTCTLCSGNFDILLAQQKRKKLLGCGCAYKEFAHQKRPDRVRDISGQRFGRCVAIKRQENGKWLCLCDCGNFFETSLSHLTTGHTKSCGCFRADNTKDMRLLDLAGKKFNKLTVIKYLYSRKHPNGTTSSVWLCLCECGVYKKVLGSEIISGSTKSCGCLKASKRELEIRKYLKDKNITFMPEYTFSDLQLNSPLKYDFAIFDNNDNLFCLIEHYGQQHFEELSRKTIFGKQQREVTDKIKQDYCKSKDLKLYIIKYNDPIKECLDKIIAELHVNTVPSKQKTV